MYDTTERGYRVRNSAWARGSRVPVMHTNIRVTHSARTRFVDNWHPPGKHPPSQGREGLQRTLKRERPGELYAATERYASSLAASTYAIAPDEAGS